MILYIIPLLEAWANLEFLRMWFFPLLALAFLATFPRIVRKFVEWR